ncbi:MAG: hypothetical protein E7E21_13340, partial [Peptostreptococcaceae bacterium]|nr:hypothetical protein [Peptostreptococcaceae bacterium]
MKLPFILRKKYNAIQNKNLKLMNDKYDLESELYLLGLKYKDLKEEVKTLRNDLKEKDKELDLAKQYNDISTNKVCELNTKLIAATTKNEELEVKIKELEFCLNEVKKENYNAAIRLSKDISVATVIKNVCCDKANVKFT